MRCGLFLCSVWVLFLHCLRVWWSSWGVVRDPRALPVFCLCLLCVGMFWCVFGVVSWWLVLLFFFFIELACGFFVSVGAWELLCCVVGVFPCRVVGGL